MIRGFFTNSIGILTSRVLGFIRDLLTASILGANIYSDIFFVAFKLPNLFRRIFGEGAFAQTFIPSFSKSKYKTIFSANIFIRFFIIILILSLLVTLFSNFFTKLIAIGFDEATVEIASNFVAINFYYLVLIFIVTYLGAILQYREHFATTAFSTALLNIALIVALLLAKDLEKLEIVYYLSYGVIAGGILQVIVHIIAIYKLNLSKILIVGFSKIRESSVRVGDEIKRFNKNFVPSILGNSSAQISAFLDTWLASFLSSGVISYLYYSNRIFQLPLAIFAIAISTAIFPRVTKAIAKKDDSLALKNLKDSFWILAFLLTTSTIIGVMLSFEITYFLFERGEFKREDTIETAYILSMYLIGLLPFGFQKIFSLWLYSKDMQKDAAKISIISLIFNVIASLILIIPMQGAGLALATTLSGFLLFVLTIKKFGFGLFWNILKDKKAIYLALISLVLIFILIIFKEFIHVYI